MSQPRRIVLPLISLIALAACAHPRPDVGGATIVQQGTVGIHGRVSDHVIVVSIDGLRPDAIAKFNAKTLQRLMREGRYSLTAQTITNSTTLPAHTSMLTGLTEQQHGVSWNDDRVAQLGYIKSPTIFSLAHNAGFSTAAFFSKTKFHHLEQPGSLDYAISPSNKVDNPWASARTVKYVAEYLAHANPNLMFVHLAEPDWAGHQFGWMGWMYGNAVREADASLAKLLREADKKFGRGGYTMIVTSDHGGHNKSHGSATDPRDLTIPWIIWGEGVQAGDTLSGIDTMDTAATALWMLGLSAPSLFAGQIVATPFTGTFTSK